MQSILFIELLGGIGDLVIALPAIQALKRSHPQAELSVLTFAPGGELLATDPGVDRLIDAPRGQVRQAVETLLAQQSFDLIISDTIYDGVEQLILNSGASKVVTNLWRNPPSDQRVGDRFLRILQDEQLIEPDSIAPPSIHLTSAEYQKAEAAFGKLKRPLVVLYPDAGMAIKRWPGDRFIALGKALQRHYGATTIIPVGHNLAEATAIASGIGGSAQIYPRGTLREFAATLAQADLVIAPDTGPARIAAALGVPTITLFGPAWHGRYGQPSPHINLQGDPECPERNRANFTIQNCWYSGICPFEQWNTCVEDISVETVLRAVDSLLSQAGIRTTDEKELVFINSEWARVKNLLVMRLDNIGDVIMTSPALRAIKENLPQVKLTLMASPGGSLAAPLLPWVDQVFTWKALWQDLGSLPFDPEQEWQLVRQLRERQFDAAIVFASFSQAPQAPAFIGELAGIPLRLGESKEQGMGSLTTAIAAAPDELHQVERNLQLIESVGFRVRDRSLGIQIPALAEQLAINQLGTHGLTPNAPFILLNPWTSCQSRNYASQRFGIAARELAEITGWPVVVTGVEKDRAQAQELLNILGQWAIDLIGQTKLAELAALIARARIMLSNNTSTMHLADAVRTPSVILFAGTELECQWQPRSCPVKLLRRPTPCSPCYAFTCPYDLECLDIPPEKVVAAALALLEQS